MQFLISLSRTVMFKVYGLLKLNGLLGILISLVFVAQVAPCNRDDQAHGPTNLESSEWVLKQDNSSCATDRSQSKEE